jgi:hypothetical protein
MTQPKQSAAPKLDPAARRIAPIVAGALFMQNLDGVIITTHCRRSSAKQHGRPETQQAATHPFRMSRGQCFTHIRSLLEIYLFVVVELLDVDSEYLNSGIDFSWSLVAPDITA